MIKDRIRIEFEMPQEMSADAKKTSDEYYELKIQLRFSFFKDNYDIKKKIAEGFYKKFSKINKIDESDDGVDIYYREYTDMNAISRYFQKNFFCEEKRSKKIVGRNFLRSKDIWRYTLLINILNLNKGDRVQIKGIEYTIKHISNNDLILTNVLDGSKNVVTYSIIKEYLKVLEK